MIGEILTFPVHADKDGALVALEKGADFPFEIKRVYYVWGASYDFVRGHHAHKSLEQVVVCTSGSCDFILDDGTKRETCRFDSPIKGLHLTNIVLHLPQYIKDRKEVREYTALDHINLKVKREHGRIVADGPTKEVIGGS